MGCEITDKLKELAEREIERMRKYRNKIAHGIPLTPEEYRDFKSIAEKMRKELPVERRGEFDQIMAGILGFIAGLLIGALISELLKGK